FQAVSRLLEEHRIHLTGLIRGIPRLDMIVEEKTQALDILSHRLAEAPKRMLEAKKESLVVYGARLNLDRLRGEITRCSDELVKLGARAASAFARAQGDAKRHLEQMAARLESVSFKKVLERGYAVVRDAN